MTPRTARRPRPTRTGRLAGRTALVTGGGRGIGRAIALALAADGCDVAVNYRRDADPAAATVADLEALGVPGRGRRGLGRRPGPRRRPWATSVLDDFGPVDLLVCNAGIASRGGTVAETSLDEVDRLMRTHVYSAVQLCRVLLPAMRGRPRGDLVFVSSVAARLMAARSAPYTMAKVALEALALTLAKEERANGIHANVGRPRARRHRDGPAPRAGGDGRRGHRHPGRLVAVRPGLPARGRRRRGPVPRVAGRRLRDRPGGVGRRRGLTAPAVGGSGTAGCGARAGERARCPGRVRSRCRQRAGERIRTSTPEGTGT